MKSMLKYLFILPLVLLNFSCDDGPTDSTVYNGDIVGSWMMTGLTGGYTYVVDLPEGDQEWPADTSFGIKLTWDKADDFPFGSFVSMWALEVEVGDTIPGVTTIAELTISDMVEDTIGLIGVFDDAPSSGSDATYKMKGRYPGIFYNYSECKSAGSTAPMTDQGLYTWDQSTYNFTIKRDPSISGSQVLPPFDDGTLTMTDDNTMNIVFKDRDSHSTDYEDIMDFWDEGKHPADHNNINSGGDRTYMAFPGYLAVYNDVFVGAYDGTNGTPSAGPAYVMDPELAYWSGYLTWYAFNFKAELEAKLDPTQTDEFIGDVDQNGAVEAADLVAFMIGTIQDGAGVTTLTPFGVPYANIIDADSLMAYALGTGGTGNGFLKNDSGEDIDILSLNDGGKLKFTVSHNDCAVPADVTIDFNVTFKKCTTDNCAGDGYHVTPTWD
jgi:hypothetical protein